MFNFGSLLFPSDGTDVFNNTIMNTTDEHEGLQVYTIGHLPRNTGGDDTEGIWTFDASGLGLGVFQEPYRFFQCLGADVSGGGDSPFQYARCRRIVPS